MWFTCLDLRYAYGQLLLSPSAANQYNFSVVGGLATGTYQFATGFNGLTDMPAELQQAIDRTLDGLPYAHAFIDDILICTKGTGTEHLHAIDEVLHRLITANVGLNLAKCSFMATNAQWLGYNLSQTGIRPGENKIDGLLNLQRPNTLEKLRGLLGSAHQLNRFFPNVANLCNPFRDLLKKDQRFQWAAQHDTAFAALKQAVLQVSDTAHFDPYASTRITCDASPTGLGAVLEQHCATGWLPICFASRFLKDSESRYSTNELELLAVVWSIEHFRNYLFGRQFVVRTDHRALLSALKSKCGNKTTFSRLARWVNRLLPYNFTLVHIPGKHMAWADYLNVSQPAKPRPFPRTIKPFHSRSNHMSWRQYCLSSPPLAHASPLN